MNRLTLFAQYPDALETRQKMRAIFLDVFPTEKVKVNVLMAAYDAGIASAIKNAKEIDDALFFRFEKILTSDFAIQLDMAQWAIIYWVEQYGIGTLGKTDAASSDPFHSEPVSEICDDQENSNLTHQKPSADNSRMTIGELAEGVKFPKSCISVNKHIFSKLGINSFKCSAKAGSFSLICDRRVDIKGEYEGKASNGILLVTMIFNEKNEMIGSSFRETISSSFNGHATFSLSVCVPKWEVVQRIEIRATLDPAMLW